MADKLKRLFSTIDLIAKFEVKLLLLDKIASKWRLNKL